MKLQHTSLFSVLTAVAALVPATTASAQTAREPGGARPLARAARGCGPGGLMPTPSNIARITRITACLINQQRTAYGLPPLRANGALGRAARGHSADMVGRGYFSHDTPQGVGPAQRISHSGYLSGGRMCALGENIAAATGSFATPAAIVNMWMSSPGHRANILSRAYRDTGLGVAYGYPAVRSAHGATFTQDFGARC